MAAKKAAPKPKNVPGQCDFSKICPVGGSFCDLTAINFLIRTEKLTRPNAEKRFLELVANNTFQVAGQIGLLGTITAYRFNPPLKP